MIKQCLILLIFALMSLSVNAEHTDRVFNDAQAMRILKLSQAKLTNKYSTIKSLEYYKEQLTNEMEDSQECIEQQKSNFKKLESTLKIISVSTKNLDPLTETADLKYLKSKQLAVKSRLGSCSLYQLKSLDLLDQLDKAIITKTKHLTWKKSNSLLLSIQNPSKAIAALSLSSASKSELMLAIAKYLGLLAFLSIITVLLFKHRKIRQFNKHLQLKSTFLFHSILVFLTLAALQCFFTYIVQFSFDTNSSLIFFEWIYLITLYIGTLIYTHLFIKAHPNLKLKKFKPPFLVMLTLALITTFNIGLYGYPYLAYYISIGILKTLAATMLAFIFILISDKLSKNLNKTLVTEAIDNIPNKLSIEFRVLSVSLKASIIICWLTFCINIWELSLSADRALLKWVNDGFIFLNLSIVPINYVKAGLIFSIITIAIRLISKSVYKSINPIFINFSYLIAGLCALSAAGVNLTGIAVIAGALSVGIGMGLKGIVNNFISGLILLIEKPIKRGDRIIVNDIEGYVKNIGLRSTEIQTPLNTDVVVPNEHLITSTVTNYMLNETSSISSITVGVAYDSDIKQAQSILLDIANNHPHILSNKKSAPWVCFKEFADSAIILQLIYSVKHAKFLFRTKSELNNKIYEEFNKHNIEFPFPQSDIYIKEYLKESNSPSSEKKD